MKNRKNIVFVESDLLEFFENHNLDGVTSFSSTYAIHHLTQSEKHMLFEKMYDCLSEGGVIVLGDLMFKNKKYESEMKEKYPDLVEDFDDELYWYLDEKVEKMQSLGFDVEIKQFSDLSWGVYGKK